MFGIWLESFTIPPFLVQNGTSQNNKSNAPFSRRCVQEVRFHSRRLAAETPEPRPQSAAARWWKLTLTLTSSDEDRSELLCVVWLKVLQWLGLHVGFGSQLLSPSIQYRTGLLSPCGFIIFTLNNVVWVCSDGLVPGPSLGLHQKADGSRFNEVCVFPCRRLHSAADGE